MAHACVTARASVLKRVSRVTFFEMGFSRTVPGGTSVLVLHLSPRVGGCYIHPLSGTVSVNDTTWAREDQCLDRTRMDGCLGSPDEMSDMRTRSRWHDRVSCDGRRHPETRDDIKTYGPCRWRLRWDVALRDLDLSKGKVT